MDPLEPRDEAVGTALYTLQLPMTDDALRELCVTLTRNAINDMREEDANYGRLMASGSRLDVSVMVTVRKAVEA